ncbi:MAG TPA: universal stress protein [Thermomicrobiaceae bacterium]|nr:universal stress protein [Thermomicrobiaceae bacterium]
MANIVVPLDGSTLSEEALSLARQLASTLGGTLELVHVVEPVPLLDLLVSDRYGEAECYLARVAEGVAGAVPVRIRVLGGDPVTELLRYAHQTPDAVIVMSTHGRGGLPRLLLGSVADKVVRGASVPVVVVQRATEVATGRPRRLLVPLDGSVLSEATLPLAARLGRDGAAIALVRVVAPPAMWSTGRLDGIAVEPDPEMLDPLMEQARQDARASLQEIARDLRGSGLSVTWEVRFGRPSDEIVRAAETTGSDLILMASHGAGGPRRWAFGSVTDEVLHRSGTAMLVIPPLAQPYARRARVPEPEGAPSAPGRPFQDGLVARPRTMPLLERMR